jgi:hypothetical protein
MNPKYNGVSPFFRYPGQFQAFLRQGTNYYHLGFFPCTRSAALKRDAAALRLGRVNPGLLNIPEAHSESLGRSHTMDLHSTGSKYRDVVFDQVAEVWYAKPRIAGKVQRRVGPFESELDAAKAADFFLYRNGVSVDRLNFPEDYRGKGRRTG